MEISILNYPQSINTTSNRHRLIDLISNIAHQPPLRPNDDKPPINFEVYFHQASQRRHRKSRNPRLNHRTPPQSSFNDLNEPTYWVLIFPDLNFGQRFLDLINSTSPHQIGFSPKTRFVQATVTLAGSTPKVKVPEPQIVFKLKTTPFKSPLEEREFQDRLRQSDRQIFLASLEYGDLCREHSRSSLAPFRPEYQALFHHHRPSTSTDLPESTPTLSHPRDPASIHVDPQSAQIIIHRVHRRCDDHYIVIQSRTIHRIETWSPSLLIFLDFPPTFHSKPHVDPNDSFISYFQSSQLVKSRQTGFDDDHRRIIPFASHVIKLNFPSSTAFQSFMVQTSHLARLKLVDLKRPVEQGAVYTASYLGLLEQINARLDLAVSFQLDTLLYNLLLNPPQIIQVSRWITDMEPSLAERVLIRLVSDLTTGRVEASVELPRRNHQTTSVSDDQLTRTFNLILTKVDSKKTNMFERRDRSGGIFKCRSVTITPTTFILEGPLPEQSNSILRLYDYNPAFIRVAIRDEGGSNYQHDREVDGRGFLKKRYLPILIHGLDVAGRNFQFLGYSQSALRCHQAWFVCPFVHQGETMTASKIRDRMGTFTKVNKNPARYMARIAQAFTTTEKAVTLLPSQLMLVEDVERNGSVFTDGVGTISVSLARQVEAALLGPAMVLRRKNVVESSCYQIRLGGYKGMISVDPTIPGEIVRLRPSMSKFDARSYTLDIAGSFRRSLPAFLNRPLIKILEDLKIPAQIFLDAQVQAIQKIEGSRASFRASAKLLEREGLGISSKFSKILRRFSSLMGTDQTDYIGSRFIHDCLDLAVIECLRSLKYRARIPLEGSYTLVGVADEDQYLQEGQVYVCIKEKKKDRKISTKYLRGPVAISRSPSIHPGDVQVVQAVGEPPAWCQRLKGLVNCVVFSVLGQRSLPSCLGGGDLDGDLYTLITDPNMIPLKANLKSPASYPPPQQKLLPQPCTIEDGMEFFLEYISSDLVGMISTRHLQIADQASLGTLDPDCLKLAALHSKAVDYPKTGVSVSVVDLPKVPPGKPDFMCPEYMFHSNQRGKLDYYESPKVLGRLFRAIPSERVEFFESSPLQGQLPQSIPGRKRQNQHQRVDRLDLDGSITRRLTRVLQAHRMVDFPDPIWKQEFEELLEAFSQEFFKICQENSLKKSKLKEGSWPLSEMEGLIGVILASSSDRRLKKDSVARLQDQTSDLFQVLRHEIIGETEDIYDDDDDGVEDDDRRDFGIDDLSFSNLSLSYTPNQTLIARALAGWHVALQADQTLFGVHSFGLTCLQMLCSELRI